ncbi:thioesterase superfamily protein [Mycobacterium sp. BK086]|uniref:acyl-CoA thioesterase domain-containing protein n=1 Tax=Mycobacterium sp. BK086 TaxID=2512165 RepID=UPI00105C88EE|nr:acyl-CoA thioesterase domain-containing protein [Mycobacterium sp. BK086]TDO12051.1 thioesterase superfamily protein [Mycobacterium sp. BK086]
MATRPAHFISDPDGTFHPTENARSRWGADMLNGPAVVGLAAFNLEQRFGLPEFLPARLTVDLFKAAKRVPTIVRTRLVRDGHRVRNAEADVVQGDVIVARATLVQYRQSEPPPGEEWAGLPTSFTPPTDADPHAFVIGSDDVGWSPGGDVHQNTSRKRVYHSPIDVVAGHAITPFVRSVIVAEATSLVSNMGTKGIGYINGDLTVALCRLPRSASIGVEGDSHWVADGISVGTGTLYDDAGPFGTGLVTAIANPAAQIDFSAPDSIPKLSV